MALSQNTVLAAQANYASTPIAEALLIINAVSFVLEPHLGTGNSPSLGRCPAHAGKTIQAIKGSGVIDMLAFFPVAVLLFRYRPSPWAQRRSL